MLESPPLKGAAATGCLGDVSFALGDKGGIWAGYSALILSRNSKIPEEFRLPSPQRGTGAWG